MKLNCDMGESFGRYSLGCDADVMPYIDMVNIACGFHAGDPLTMETTVRHAIEHGVKMGAHPGYPDLQGFGRRQMGVSADDVRRTVLYQAGALSAFCRAAGGSLSYVKPHGALYNRMMQEDTILAAVMDGVAAFKSLDLMIQATPRWQVHQEMAQERGIRLYLEAFADRAYEATGSLRNRELDGAVLDEEGVVERVRQLCLEGVIHAVDGSPLQFPIDSLCVHGDNHAGVKQLATIRKLLDASDK